MLRYWVGGSGNWDTTSTAHWAASSGGASGASVPTTSDDVVFDANSFSASGQVVTIPGVGVNARSIVWTGVTHNPEWRFDSTSSTASMFMTSSLVLSAGMTMTNIDPSHRFPDITIRPDSSVGTAPNIYFLDPQGVTIPIELDFQIRSTFQLQGDLTCEGIRLQNGQGDYDGVQQADGLIFNTNNHTINVGFFQMNTNYSQQGITTLNAGTSVFNIGAHGRSYLDDGFGAYDRYVDINFSAGFVINLVYDAVPLFTYVSPDVFLHQQTIATINCQGLSSPTSPYVLDSDDFFTPCTFGEVVCSPGAALEFFGGDGVTGGFNITRFHVQGTAGNLTTIMSDPTFPSSQFKIISNDVNVAYVDLQSCVAEGATPFNDANGVDSGNNVDWTFVDNSPHFTEDPLFNGLGTTCVTVEGFVPDCTGISEFGIVYSNNTDNPTIFDTVETFICNQGDFSFLICNLIPGERYVFGIYTRSGSGLINYYDYRAVNINALVKKKRYYYKVYNTITGAYITTWSTDVISDPKFRMVINGGAGELMVRLGRTYSNFNEGIDVSLNNRVECWVMDRDNPEGTKIYTGYISAYSPVIDDENQYVDVTLLGFATRLAVHPLRDAATSLTTITYNSIEPATIMKDFIDKYHDDGGTDVFYTNSSIQNTNTVASYTFINNTLQEAVDKVIELTPENWFWYVDANSIIFLQPANIARPDHKVTIGKDLAYLSSNKRLENMTNAVTVIGGGSPTPLYNYYTRPVSIALYGKWEKRLQDGRVTSNTTSDLMAKRQLDRFDTPEYRTTLKIIDNNGENQLQGADIEHFFPGETIQVVNLPNAPILIIQSINYTPYYIEIEAATRLPEISKDFTYLTRNVVTTSQTDLPTTPTVRTV